MIEVHHKAYRLPLPPSVNNYWSNARRRGKRSDGSRFTYTGRSLSKAAKSFHAQAMGAILEQGRVTFGDAPVVVELFIHPRLAIMENAKTGDVDNFSKGTLDALTKAQVFDDDDQVVRLQTLRRKPIEGGGILAEIRLASDEEIRLSQTIEEGIKQ